MRAPIALLVDDDNDFRSLFAEVLKEEGYRVLEASDGAQAMGLLEQVTPDVMVVDLAMPVMSGWAFYSAVDEKPALRSVPIVFLSALPEMAPRGGSLVVGKPLDLTSLTRLLDALRPEATSGNVLAGAKSPRESVYPLDWPTLKH